MTTPNLAKWQLQTREVEGEIEDHQRLGVGLLHQQTNDDAPSLTVDGMKPSEPAEGFS